jgi:hypothetical protein
MILFSTCFEQPSVYHQEVCTSSFTVFYHAYKQYSRLQDVSDTEVCNNGAGVLIGAFAPISTPAYSRTKMSVHINDGTVMFTLKYCFCSTHIHAS